MANDEYLAKYSGPSMDAALDKAMASISTTDLPIESGTWTPIIKGDSTAGNNTYTTQYGFYYRIGKLVFITGTVQINTKDTAMAGNIQFGGLPFAARYTNYANGGITVCSYWDFTGISAAYGLSLQYTAGLSCANLLSGGANTVVNVTAANVQNGSALIFSGVYSID